ncbi:MAG: hypothetical protein LBU28_09850 [Spirochaetaceae bacterium]|nr:hypothetical protein [Spirochaetaceae bacterium]
MSGQFQERVTGEIAGKGGFRTQMVEAIPGLAPDYPPDAVHLGGADYSLTGEYYVDMDSVQHFQLWMWTNEGVLVYTDEMIFEDQEEVDAYLPPLVAWILSKIPQELVVEAEPVVEIEPVEEPVVVEEPEEEEPPPPPPNRLFMGSLKLGLRAGASYIAYIRHYTSAEGYEGEQVRGFSGEGALSLEFRIFRFLSLQTEAVFNADVFQGIKPDSQGSRNLADRHMAISLLFPLLIKMPLEMDTFTISPYGGAYFSMPVRRMPLRFGTSGDNAYTYHIESTPGLMMGADVGFLLGEGELFVDLRFGRDLGVALVENETRLRYSRTKIWLSLGYRITLWQRQ